MSIPCPLSQKQILDHSFLECRSKILELAACLDRLDRSIEKNGKNDIRYNAIKETLQILIDENPARTEKILMLLSDHQVEFLEKRDIQNAIGVSQT